MEVYNPPKADRTRVRKSVCIPDQSLSVQEIVRRFVRGVPVDVVQREAVYIDQNDHDLEKLSRMDFGEKAEFARSEAERLKQWRSELTDAEEAKKESARVAKEESEAKAAAARHNDEVIKAMEHRAHS